jgi:hypothetical protein
VNVGCGASSDAGTGERPKQCSTRRLQNIRILSDSLQPCTWSGMSSCRSMFFKPTEEHLLRPHPCSPTPHLRSAQAHYPLLRPRGHLDLRLLQALGVRTCTLVRRLLHAREHADILVADEIDDGYWSVGVVREHVVELWRERAEGREPRLRRGRGFIVLVVLAGLQATKEGCQHGRKGEEAMAWRGRKGAERKGRTFYTGTFGRPLYEYVSWFSPLHTWCSAMKCPAVGCRLPAHDELITRCVSACQP